MGLVKEVEMGNYPRLSKWDLNATIRILTRGRQREMPQQKWRRQCDYRRRDWSDDKPNNAGSHQKIWKSRRKQKRERDSPHESPEEVALPTLWL